MNHPAINLKRTVIKNRTKPHSKFAKDMRKQFLGNRELKSSGAKELRIVLYSHDTMGIGHMRRNLLIAQKIKRQFKKVSILVIAGAKEAAMFAQASEIDCLTLPAFKKLKNGSYKSRFLKIRADEVLHLRSKTILTAIKSYRPNLFVIDKVPGGAGGELLRTLKWLAKSHPCTCVLGLREILDEVAIVRQELLQTHAFDVIRNYFDAIWVYGDRNVFDTAAEYDFPDDICQLVNFTGYLDSSLRLDGLSDYNEFRKPYVLCTVGGGQDGKQLAENFVEAIRKTGRNSILLLGPHMPTANRTEIRRQAEGLHALQLVDYVHEGDLLIRDASHVISMGGYNTLSAVLSYGKPALVVPRVVPRTEQLIRSTRLSDLGLVETVHPDQLSPAKIARWLDRNEEPSNKTGGQQTLRRVEGNGKAQSHGGIELNGLERICDLIKEEFPSVKNRKPRGRCHA